MYIRVSVCIYAYTHMYFQYVYTYGVATVSRIDSIIGLFCRILSLLQGSFAKGTYNFIDPTSRSHPIIHIFMSYVHNIYMYTYKNIVYKCLSCIHVFINVCHIYTYTNTLIRTYMHELFVSCIHTYTHTSKLCKHRHMQLPLISSK